MNADNWGTALGSGRYAVQEGGILPTSQGRRETAGRRQQLSGARAPQCHLLGGRLSRWPQPPRRRPMPRCWCGGGGGCAPRRRRRWMTCGCARTTARRRTETPPATVEERGHAERRSVGCNSVAALAWRGHVLHTPPSRCLMPYVACRAAQQSRKERTAAETAQLGGAGAAAAPQH